jgi:hypothetical protein
VLDLRLTFFEGPSFLQRRTLNRPPKGQHQLNPTTKSTPAPPIPPEFFYTRLFTPLSLLVLLEITMAPNLSLFSVNAILILSVPSHPTTSQC